MDEIHKLITQDFIINKVCINCIEDLEGYKGINSMIYKKMSKYGYISLPYGGVDKMICYILPGEIIEKITLYAILEGKIIPIKSIYNITGEFSFFDKPIFIGIDFIVSVKYKKNVNYEKIWFGINYYSLRIEDKKKCDIIKLKLLLKNYN
jgi:hypothetical protein